MEYSMVPGLENRKNIWPAINLILAGEIHFSLSFSFSNSQNSHIL